MGNDLLILVFALVNLFCGVGIGFLAGTMKERADWKNKLAEKGILSSNWHRVTVARGEYDSHMPPNPW